MRRSLVDLDFFARGVLARVLGWGVICARSSADRVLPSEGKGRRFESCRARKGLRGGHNGLFSGKKAVARMGGVGVFNPPQKPAASERVNPKGYALSTRVTREVRST